MWIFGKKLFMLTILRLWIVLGIFRVYSLLRIRHFRLVSRHTLRALVRVGRHYAVEADQIQSRAWHQRGEAL